MAVFVSNNKTFVSIKPKILFIFSLLVFTFIEGYSFNNKVDSLHAAVESTDDLNKIIDIYLQISSELINIDLDSAMLYAEKANVLIETLESDSARTEVFLNLGQVYQARGNFALSLDYLFRAQRILEEIVQSSRVEVYPYQKQLIQVYSSIGVTYFYQGVHEKALYYYELALDNYESINRDAPHLHSASDKGKLFNNLAGVYIRMEEYDRAIEYYKTALELINPEVNIRLSASFYNNLGICYMEKYASEMAFHYFQKALDIRSKIGDKRGIAQCYNNIGKNYSYKKQYDKALESFLFAYKLGREIGNKESIRLSLQSLHNIYRQTGEYVKAYNRLIEFKGVSDSLFNSESINRISRLELDYKFEKQQQLFDLEIQKNEAEKAKRELFIIIISSLLFFTILTLVLLVFLHRRKIRYARLRREHFELESKHLTLEKEKLTEQLDFKNRELATNVMYLLKKNELIASISEKLIKSKLDFKKENQQIVQEIIYDLRSNMDTDSWAEFEAHFTQVHTDFYKTLNEQFPNLTSNEKKLCAFLKLNMTTKDIASITYQSVKSISVARSRLRKKLSIEGEDVNLVNFLSQF